MTIVAVVSLCAPLYPSSRFELCLLPVRCLELSGYGVRKEQKISVHYWKTHVGAIQHEVKG
jgi:hypothetical protein